MVVAENEKPEGKMNDSLKDPFSLLGQFCYIALFLFLASRF
jgi:hypothetical protein